MPVDKSLFHFSKSEISHFLKRAPRIFKDLAMDILALPRKENYGRLLVITPKKIGTAPQRNQLRRRLKSIFYEEKLFELPSDYVIFTKKAALELPFEDLKGLLVKALKQ